MSRGRARPLQRNCRPAWRCARRRQRERECHGRVRRAEPVRGRRRVEARGRLIEAGSAERSRVRRARRLRTLRPTPSRWQPAGCGGRFAKPSPQPGRQACGATRWRRGHAYNLSCGGQVSKKYYEDRPVAGGSHSRSAARHNAVEFAAGGGFGQATVVIELV